MKKADRELKSRLKKYIDIEISNHHVDLLSVIINRNVTTDSSGITTLTIIPTESATTEVAIPHQSPILKHKNEIRDALLLDLQLYPRPSRTDKTKTILLQTNQHKSNRGWACQSLKHVILLTAKYWGFENPSITYAEKM